MIPKLSEYLSERINLSNDTVSSWFSWIYMTMLDFDQYYNKGSEPICDYMNILKDYMIGELGAQSIIGRGKLKKKLLDKFNEKDYEYLHDFLDVIFQKADNDEELAKDL